MTYPAEVVALVTAARQAAGRLGSLGQARLAARLRAALAALSAPPAPEPSGELAIAAGKLTDAIRGYWASRGYLPVASLQWEREVDLWVGEVDRLAARVKKGGP